MNSGESHLICPGLPHAVSAPAEGGEVLVMVHNWVRRAQGIVQGPGKVQTLARRAPAAHSPGSWHLAGCLACEAEQLSF